MGYTVRDLVNQIYNSTTNAIYTQLVASSVAIGKLAANSGVDIGDVDVTSISAGTNTIGDVGARTYSTVASGERQGSATAVQLPSVSCSVVSISAATGNAGNVYLGGAGVTVPNGTTDTTSGLELEPGDMTQFIPTANLNVFYIICDNAGDDITYLALS